MNLMLTVGDPVDDTGRPVIEGSSRTLVGGAKATYLGAATVGCPPPPTKHGGGNQIVFSNTSGRTTINGKSACANGAKVNGPCSSTISAKHTQRTYC